MYVVCMNKINSFFTQKFLNLPDLYMYIVLQPDHRCIEIPFGKPHFFPEAITKIFNCHICIFNKLSN